MSMTIAERGTGRTIQIDSFLVEQITGGKVVGRSGQIRFKGATYHSAMVVRDNMFVALRGKRRDGHHFLEEATERGAAVLLVESGHPELAHIDSSVMQIQVKDTLVALGALARWHRDQFDIPFVAVTGSNGKTTTKEMIAAILESKFEVFKTPGNLNSRIGLPISLFDLHGAHTIGVCEMGMSTRGEIDALGRIIRPQYAVFTNIANAHLETLKTIEEVAAAKFELLDHLLPDGIAFFCADDPRLLKKARSMGPNARTYGLSGEVDLRATHVKGESTGIRFTLESGERVALPLFGRHNASNALAALLVARTLHVDTRASISALATLKSAPHRSTINRFNGLTVIDDAYNANPSATLSAVESLMEFPVAGRRVVLLGDMLELGEQSESMHAEVGERVADLMPDLLVTVGDRAKGIGEAALASGLTRSRHVHFDAASDCGSAASSWCKPRDTVLVKGSRSIALEHVVDILSTLFESNPKEVS